MSNLVKNTYIMKDVNMHNLKTLGFKYDKLRSSDTGNVYTYSFTVYKYKKTPIINCSLSVNQLTKEVSINVYTQAGTIYADFYNKCNGNNDSVYKTVNSNIKKEFLKLGIEDIKKAKEDKHAKN